MSTTANSHREIVIWARTQSILINDNYQTILIDICGEEEVTLNTDGPQEYVLNLDPGKSVNLMELIELGSFMEWFNSSDPTCNFSNFTLVENSETFVPLTNDNILLDLENGSIFVKTDTSLDLTFFLNASTVGNAWNIQEISVFVCGEEKVSF